MDKDKIIRIEENKKPENNVNKTNKVQSVTTNQEKTEVMNVGNIKIAPSNKPSTESIKVDLTNTTTTTYPSDFKININIVK